MSAYSNDDFIPKIIEKTQKRKDKKAEQGEKDGKDGKDRKDGKTKGCRINGIYA
jgi:hypothetical protein